MKRQRRNDMKAKEANRPVFTKKVGNVRAIVWCNKSDSNGNSRQFLNVQLERIYVENGEFKATQYFNGLGDVACLLEALRHAANWLSEQDDVQEVESEE